MFSIKRLSQSIAMLYKKNDFRAVFCWRNYSKCIQPKQESPQILNVPATELETSKDNPLNNFLIDYVLKNPSRTTAATAFTTLFEQLISNANLQLPSILPYEHAGRKNITTQSDLARGIITVAHILPLQDKVIVASGFGVLDGGLIVTCAHTFYQAARYIPSSDSDQKSQTIVITHEGELIPIVKVESHLVSSDLVLLRLEEGRKITSLAVDPYPAPKSTSLLSYEFVTGSLSSTSLPTISHAWKSAEVLFYRDRCGHEARTGSYDELSCMLYSHPPSNGSSGGPIVNQENKAVVGIVRGSEVSYANRKRIGFAIPSESLFEAFKLPGMPDGL